MGSKNKGKATRERRSRSRNTTPLSSITTTESPVPGYFQTSILPLAQSQTFDDILGSTTTIPSASNLASMLEQVKTMNGAITIKGEKFDLLMRELSKKQREREQEAREQERERERQAQEDERRKGKADKAKSASSRKKDREEERPLAVGAHGLARQDGGAMDQGQFKSSALSFLPI